MRCQFKRKQDFPFIGSLGKRKEKGQANYIASLQPTTLAAVKPWGNSKGADRIGLTRRKDNTFF